MELIKMQIAYIVVGGMMVAAGYLLCFFTMNKRTAATEKIYTDPKRRRAQIKPANFKSPIAPVDLEHLGLDKKTGVFSPVSTKAKKGSARE